MQDKEQQLEVDMEQWTGSKLGKEYVKAIYCHPASHHFNYLTNQKEPKKGRENFPFPTNTLHPKALLRSVLEEERD